MTKFKIHISLLLSFFVVLAISTIYSYISFRNNLPVVILSQPQQVDGTLYDVPSASVYHSGENQYYVFVVKQKRGAWGKEYVCARQVISVVNTDDDRLIIAANLGRLPIAVQSTAPLNDGMVVRLS